MFDKPTLPKLFQDAPQMQEFMEVWHDARADKLMPARSAITLPKLRGLASSTVFLEYVSAEKIIYLNTGSTICDRLGSDPTHTNILDHSEEDVRPNVSKLWQGMMEKPCGTVVRVKSHYRNGKVGEVDLLYLPVEGEDGKKLITGFYAYFGWLAYRNAESPRIRVDVLKDTFRWIDIGAGVN